MNKLNNLGLAHIFLPIIVIVAIAGVGTYMQIASKAATPTATTSKYKLKKLSGSNLKEAKNIASDYWGNNLCGKNGKKIKMVWFDDRKFFKEIFNDPSLADESREAQINNGPETYAFAYHGAGLDSNDKQYCKIFFNKQAVKLISEYFSLKHGMNAAETQCIIMVHEAGHLSGYAHSQGYKGDNHHSPSSGEVMYGGGLSKFKVGGTAIAPRCLSEL